MDQFTGFIFGDTNKPEFQFLNNAEFDFMRKIFIPNNKIFTNCREVVDILSGGIEPDIIIIAQSYPDQFPINFMYWIRNCWSITPVLLLLGVGNGGEVRTGTPLVGCLRIYAHEWNNFWQTQLHNYATNNKSIFDLPPTCGDDEIFLATSKNNPTNLSYKYKYSKNNKNPNNICLIISNEGALGNDCAMNKYLADYATSLGYNCVYNHHNLCYSPKLVLIDTDDSGFAGIIESVQRFRCMFADSEFNVYINSPRFNEIAELKSIGVDVVIPKPFFWC
ncbi:MAG: hypothetical protein LBH59_04760 [Planctomycetaceae bacterium]|jgi:hypothetical protein|nr:hypothetical protein [Planctomycetaceae bacterium]